MIRKFIRSRTLFAVLAAAISMPVFAGAEDQPGAGAMVADALIARPLGVVFTAVGAATFVVHVGDAVSVGTAPIANEFG